MTTSSLLLAGLLIMPHALAQAAEPELPPDAAYCTVDAAGHLSIGGERRRFWGAIGSFPGPQQTIAGDPYAFQRRIVQRARTMGFNLVRHWDFPCEPYIKGDLSRQDLNDFFIAECARQDVRVWAAGIASVPIFLEDLPKAARLAGDPAEAEAWIAATSQLAKKHWWSGERMAIELGHGGVMTVWDDRLEAWLGLRLRERAQHLNQHAGLRYADDPVMAVWELSNEQWWTTRMTSGDWQRLPAFFRASLSRRWHEFLRAKYADQAALTAAWGFLLPGEDAAAGTVLLMPLERGSAPAEINDGSPQAQAAFQSAKQAYGREHFNRQRGADVMEFLATTIVAHKQRLRGQMRSAGKSCRLSPLLHDTGIGYDPPSQYLHQLADGVAHDAYMEGLELGKIKPGHRRHPFYSGLDQPPRLCKDVPWLEHNKVEGKPFLCYETQLGAPAKYRAEWPVRLAALASIQDWDAICWHYWGITDYDFTRERPFEGPISRPGPGQFQYHYTFDEVEFSAMRASAAVFRSLALAPAPRPTRYTYGRPALYDPAAMDYAGGYGREGWNMLLTTWQHGVRIAIDPRQEQFLVVDGPQIRFNGFELPLPFRPTSGITFDYQRAEVTFDAPAVAAYTGFFAQHGQEQVAFANGAVLADIVHANPPQAPYPVGADERYLSFTLVAEDGKPLAASTRALISLVSSSMNSGTRIAAVREESDFGQMPVLVTRVGARVVHPGLAGMRWRMLDFHERTLAEGVVADDGAVHIPAELPVWLTELVRP